MSDAIVIESGRRDLNYWRDLWRYRELFYVLAWRDIAVRYKQTVIGAAWALIRPLLTMVVFSVVFGRIAKLPSEGMVPYALMVFAGTLPWTFFSTGLAEASNSMLGNASLINKVYFPRLIVPIAAVMVALADFLVAFVILVGMMAWYGFVPGWQILFLPLFVLLCFVISIGPALWLTGLNVKYRDFRHIVPFALQLGLYISPVGFSSNIVPDQWRLVYSLNPMVGVIEGFRWCLFAGQSQFNATSITVSIVVAAFFLWFGLGRFRKTEKSFSDLI